MVAEIDINDFETQRNHISRVQYVVDAHHSVQLAECASEPRPRQREGIVQIASQRAVGIGHRSVIEVATQQNPVLTLVENHPQRVGV